MSEERRSNAVQAIEVGLAAELERLSYGRPFKPRQRVAFNELRCVELSILASSLAFI